MNGGPVVLVLMAGAVVMWPARSRPVWVGLLPGATVAAPSRGRFGVPIGTGRLPARRVLTMALLVGGVLAVGALTGSAPLAIAVLLIALTSYRLVSRARRAARERRLVTGLATSLRALIRELAAGTTPGEALLQVAADAPPAVRAVIGSLNGGPLPGERTAARPAGASSAGGAPSAAAWEPDTAGPAVGAIIARLRAVWALSAQRGLPLAVLLTACRADLDGRVALLDLRATQVAGPAVSGYVLAVLPLAGIAMGIGMDANPLGVLLGTSLGGVLLVVGVALCCAGLLWCGRITRGGRDG